MALRCIEDAGLSTAPSTQGLGLTGRRRRRLQTVGTRDLQTARRVATLWCVFACMCVSTICHLCTFFAFDCVCISLWMCIFVCMMCGGVAVRGFENVGVP